MHGGVCVAVCVHSAHVHRAKRLFLHAFSTDCVSASRTYRPAMRTSAA